MNRPRNFLRSFFHATMYLVVSVLVIAALLLSVARLMLPAIEEYRPDIESWVSQVIGQEVEIATLDAAWYGLEPQLVLKGVQLLSPDRNVTTSYFQQARIGLNIFSSLFHWRLIPGGLTVEGASFSFVRRASGNVTLSGVKERNINKVDKSSDGANQVLSDWLFSQRILDVRDSEIFWLDEENNKNQWHFTKVNLKFRNDGDHHIVHGSVNLPDEIGARLEVAIDANGDLLSANGWSGSAYFEAANLLLEPWAKEFPDLNFTVSNGLVGLRLWSTWRKANLIALKGDVFSNGFKIASKKSPKVQSIESLSTNINVQKISNYWEATLDRFTVSTAKSTWPQFRLDSKIDVENKQTQTSISQIRIGDLLPIASVLIDDNEKLSTLLAKLSPAGEISDLHFDVGLKDEKPIFYAKGSIEDYQNKPWKKIPGFTELELDFELSDRSAHVRFPKQNFSLDYSGAFEFPAALKDVQGELYWIKRDVGSSVIAKDLVAQYLGATAKGSLQVDILPDKNHHIDLSFHFLDGQVKNAKYYIPSRLMKKTAADWIKQALVSGNVEKGGLLYFGKVKEFPFVNNEGLFDVDLEVSNGTLNFAKGWPEINKIEGLFELNANALSFSSSSAKTLNVPLKNVFVEFPIFRTKHPKLKIVGEVEGDSAKKLNYLHNSPLEDIFAKNISPIKMAGNSELELELDIPLRDIKSTQVNGEIEIKDNTFEADEWRLDIQSLSTRLSFNNQGINAERVTGVMDGVTLNGNIITKTVEEGYNLISIANQSEVNDIEMARMFGRFLDKSHWGDYIAGNTTIATEIEIPLLAKEVIKGPKINLSLSASLNDIAIELPYPLSKSYDEKDTIVLSADLSGEKRLLEIETNNLNAIFEIVPAGDQQVITRGGVGFHQAAELPLENGYRYVGRLDRFSWTRWEPIIFPSEHATPLLAEGDGSSSQYFDVEIEKLELFGSWFGKTMVQASSGSQLWSIHLSGDDLAGEVFLPVVLSSAPLIMNFERLKVERGKINSGDDKFVYLDPRVMPEIQIDAKNFTFNDINFGHLKGHAKKIDAGLRLDDFSMINKTTQISAKGNWIEIDDEQTSTFDVLVKTNQLGTTVKSWGFSDAFGGGVGDIKLNARWENKPTDFSFATAKGSLKADIKDASLLDFELGAAKMVGLFLPRRLLLDFRDVFNKGMHFDSIKGEYQIDEGSAYTADLRLDGPAADILMAGRIGLVAEDYDQLITVNRRLVGDSLSTLAALATNPLVNPVLAAQVFALKKLFEKQIDEILSVQYTIKGPWESPKITPVVKNLEDRGEHIEDLFESE